LIPTKLLSFRLDQGDYMSDLLSELEQRNVSQASQPQLKSRDWTAPSVYTLGFLTLISSFNYLDRSILGLVLPLIKTEMQVSDTVLGLVSGLAFVLFYSLLGIPIAWAADRWNRRNIIAIGFFFWSLMTTATGFVVNIWQLALTRFLMGAGEACGIAPSNSLIADVFHPARRALALSIFGTAFAIASLLFFPIAGWISDSYGWRAAFVAAGVPGLMLAIIFALTVKEPARGASETTRTSAATVSFIETIKFMSGARTYLLILLGVTFMGANVYAAGIWSATFLVRVHGMSISEIASIIGPVRGILGVIGVLLGGILVDRLGGSKLRWRMYVPGVACLLVAPAEAAFLLGDTTAVWVVGFAATSLLTFLHQGPIYAAAMSVAQPRMRATATAVLLLCASLVGQAFGPLLVGWLNDRLNPVYGDLAIRYSMLVIVLCAIITSFCFLLGARTFGEDSRRATGEPGPDLSATVRA
jgi:MFS family permease